METTHSTKVVIALCAAVAVVAFIGGYFLRDQKAEDDTANATATPKVSVVKTVTPTATVASKPVSYTVKLTATGLSPASLTVKRGDTVTILNTSGVSFWPASNPHPSHSDCPGFDALRGLSNGESYTVTFSSIQTCGYHNHLDPANASMQGTITVR